jgi:hypothetical protein
MSARHELIDSIFAAHPANQKRLLNAMTANEERVLAALLRRLLTAPPHNCTTFGAHIF